MNRALKQAINKAAHAAAQSHYTATRAQLMADAERMLAEGQTMAQVIAALSCARVRSRAGDGGR